MTPSDMFRLAKEVEAALQEPTVLGAVVLHGTDVLAESAYMCDIVINSDKPVVLTGSMRYYSESGYDASATSSTGCARVCCPSLPAPEPAFS